MKKYFLINTTKHLMVLLIASNAIIDGVFASCPSPQQMYPRGGYLYAHDNDGVLWKSTAPTTVKPKQITGFWQAMAVLGNRPNQDTYVTGMDCSYTASNGSSVTFTAINFDQGFILNGDNSNWQHSQGDGAKYQYFCMYENSVTNCPFFTLI